MAGRKAAGHAGELRRHGPCRAHAVHLSPAGASGRTSAAPGALLRALWGGSGM